MRLLKAIAVAAALVAASLGSAPVQAGGGHGDAAVAGVAGFAAGAILGNALSQPRGRYVGQVYSPPPVVVYQPAPVYYVPQPWTPDWYSYCASKYRSFDARSGTFIGYDGYRQMCR